MENFENLAERASAACLSCGRVSAAELEKALGVPVQQLIESVGASSVPEVDSFPPADADGQWEWPAVRAWVLRRNDPIPNSEVSEQGWQVLRDWLLRNLPIEHQCFKAPAELERDKRHGLTLGQRDFVERVLTAEAAGRTVPSPWVERILVLDGTDEVTELLVQVSRPTR
ncbi:hypothetical protein ACFCY8_10450 [Streptomyces noursei]|uniref:hypothetical protein n=1 Tax=Streptomyces noursei TaxID=1971 RepID=UPI0035D84C36